jgi:hypothetical protein
MVINAKLAGKLPVIFAFFTHASAVSANTSGG